MTPQWPEGRIERLRTLWADGLSTAEIGIQLHISTNAVIGKVRRLRLPSRRNPVLSPLLKQEAIDWQKVRQMRAAGCTWRHIARVSGVSVDTLSSARLSRGPEFALDQSFRFGVAKPRAPKLPALPSAMFDDPRKEPRTVVERRQPAPPPTLPPPPTASTCQWPLNDGYPWRFCGCSRVVAGRPYCAAHVARAYSWWGVADAR